MARLAFDLSVLRVLLVEDDTFSRELEKAALQHLGIARITLANDGADALDALQRGIACDLIVSDWNMPNFGGLELLAAVRENWPGIPFLMVTNNETIDQIKVATDAGVDGYLIKPFSLDKLRETLQLALISKLAGGSKPLPPRPTNPELEKISASIQSVLHQAKEKGKSGDTPEQLQNTNNLAEKLSVQLDGLMQTLDATDPQQMEVIRLHVDCLRAVLSNRADLLEHETQNLIVDGLSLATELVLEGA